MRIMAAPGVSRTIAALAEVTSTGCGIWAIDPVLVRNLFALARVQADAVSVIEQLETGRVEVMERLVRRLVRMALRSVT
jgi:hypothetical protein